MPNRSHRNAGHIGMNRLRKSGLAHSSTRGVPASEATGTSHIVDVADCLEMLAKIPDQSIQLVMCDPPYNINVAAWDDLEHYVEWRGNGSARSSASWRRRAISCCSAACN